MEHNTAIFKGFVFLFCSIFCSHFEFCRILDQWLNVCSAQGTPLVQAKKVSEEFKKRMDREGTHEAKEKLKLNNCDLTDQNVRCLFFSILLFSLEIGN